jgi:hypothetical protein
LNWIELNWIELCDEFRVYLLYSVLRQHPVQYHAHHSNSNNRHSLSHYIIYILYYFGWMKFFSSNESINTLVNKEHTCTHTHTHTHKRAHTTNAVMLLPPYKIKYTYYKFSRKIKSFSHLTVLRNSLASYLVAISISIQ